ncbi:hypothetical protein HMPREF3182_00842 [Megasphaera hutchinsoni]|uniref:Uncharacterized protein n=1 Tax=Megasphaera hutchinsoni TaxID=1588748 RepID=A0A134CGR8_9FIRM|nr:hypothetical protein HMPREF3182_00842 [Megasphaera hutchinsoni]
MYILAIIMLKKKKNVSVDLHSFFIMFFNILRLLMCKCNCKKIVKKYTYIIF